jgi:hypothetical protein
LEHLAVITAPVVGRDPLAGDAKSSEPGEREFEEGHGAFLALIGQDFGVGQPRGVIDADVETFPAEAVMLVDGNRFTGGNAIADLKRPSFLISMYSSRGIRAESGPSGLADQALSLG